MNSVGRSVILPSICNRQYGGSARDCACRLTGGGWAECPPDARGILVEAPVVLAAAFIVPAQIPPRLAGEFCHNCHGPNVVRTGTCLTCQDCGDSSAGCS